MSRGTSFGTIHSNTDLLLIQQKVEVSPAQPKMSFIDVPGADGSVDVTEAVDGIVHYYDREIKWTFALQPGENWYETQKNVSNALNGLRCNIAIDEDPNYYYEGRVSVENYNSDKLLKQITVKATCKPYKKEKRQTFATYNSITDILVTKQVENGKMPVRPTVSANVVMKIEYEGREITIYQGDRVYEDFMLKSGTNTFSVKKAVAGGVDGRLELEFRKGEL